MMMEINKNKITKRENKTMNKKDKTINVDTCPECNENRYYEQNCRYCDDGYDENDNICPQCNGMGTTPGPRECIACGYIGKQ